MDIAEAPSYYLDPGYIYFSRTAATVRTVVGSCVAVCLWDKVLCYGGMNHFVQPFTQDPRNATPRYGNVAIAALIRMMEEAGCKREDLVAQILGGAYPKPRTNTHIGMRNVRVARDMLMRKQIRIASEDVGGTMGRKLIFDTGSGEMAVLKVNTLRDSDWILDEGDVL